MPAAVYLPILGSQCEQRSRVMVKDSQRQGEYAQVVKNHREGGKLSPHTSMSHMFRDHRLASLRSPISETGWSKKAGNQGISWRESRPLTCEASVLCRARSRRWMSR